MGLTPQFKTTEAQRKQTRQWQVDNPEAHKLHIFKAHLKCKYNMTLEEYDELVITQNKVCAICEKSCKLFSRLSVDHCHNSKKVRGLLCNDCNLLLGNAHDDITILENAVEYMKARI